MKLPIPPPSLRDLTTTMAADKQVLSDFLDAVPDAGGPAPGGKYRHWDTLRHCEPPEHLSVEQWWLAIKMARLGLYKPLPLKDTKGKLFRLAMPDVAWRMLRDIDARAAGALGTSEQIVQPRTRDTYIVKSLIDEAVTSSQLEGAAMTRRQALEMIRSNRHPRDKSERMVLNNYQAMHFIRSRSTEPLSPETVFRLHRILTEDTLEDPDEAGRFRTEEDDIVVQDVNGVLLHRPPSASELPSRLEEMCRFANDDGDDSFIHPVVRSILLHFWLAYDHPFTDGNGRTARALFYWSMIRRDYWLSEFISISKILRGAPSRYIRAFLYTETDDNDTTYFVLNQLRVIVRALDELYEYLEKKAHEMRETRRILDKDGLIGRVLNHRQIDVIRHALRHPHFTYTFSSHRTSHGISYQTARTDLLELTDLGLLIRGKSGGRYIFDVPADLNERLDQVQA